MERSTRITTEELERKVSEFKSDPVIESYRLKMNMIAEFSKPTAYYKDEGFHIEMDPESKQKSSDLEEEMNEYLEEKYPELFNYKYSNEHGTLPPGAKIDGNEVRL